MEPILQEGRIEAEYAEMARSAGIQVADSHLLEAGGRCHFLSRRFDRKPGGERLHLHSYVGISPSTSGQWLSALERSGILSLLEPWFSNRTKSLVKSPKLHFQDSGLCAFLMGMNSVSDLHDSPLVGALWETMVFSEFHRLLAAGIGTWQLAFWRDRAKEADFLLYRAGHTMLADAKWTQHPPGAGRLERVRAEFQPTPPVAILCRCETPYPLGHEANALPLTSLNSILS